MQRICARFSSPLSASRLMSCASVPAACGASHKAASKYCIRMLSASTHSAANVKLIRQASLLPPWLSVANIKKFSPQIAAAAGACIVVYGLSKTMVYVTGSILSLDMYDVFYAGFWTGVVSAAIFATGGVMLSRMITINPKTVLRKAASKVSANATAQAALGNTIRVGHLRAYTAHNGHVSLSKQFGWVEPRAQVLFQVAGEKGEGFVTAEAVRHRGNIVFNLIALDAVTKGAEGPQLLLLKGSEDKLHVKGALRGFLQVDRATYISQERVEDDDARIREQEKLPAEEPEEASPSSQLR